MTEFKDLQTIASSMYSNEDMKHWLFKHTHNETEYEQVRRALKVLSRFQPVEWVGKPGNRQARELV